jgi:hypothetical protein
MKNLLGVVALAMTMTMFAVGCVGEESAEETASESSNLIGDETFTKPAVGVTTDGVDTGCSGTLVATNVVLLAGHCFDGGKTKLDPQWKFEIRKSATEKYRFDTIDGWVKGRNAGGDDVALVRLAAHVPASIATPIPIATRWPSYGTRVELMGFGCNTANGGARGIKRHTYATYSLRWDAPGGWATRVLCGGDSGGALLAGNTVIGVLSGYQGDWTDLFGDPTAYRAEIMAQIRAWQ